MDKKDIRIYFDADFCDHLKSIAKDKGISVNSLVSELVKKKYPIQNKDISIKLNDSKIELLKIAAQERNTTISELLVSLVDDFLMSHKQSLDAGTDDMTLEDEKQPLDILSSSATVPTVADVPTEESETLSVVGEITVAPDEDTDNQEITIPDDEDSTYKYFDGLLSRGSTPELFTKKERKAMKRRITAINNMIKTAQETGNHIPKPVYAQIVEQKKALIPIVYPEGNSNNQ